MRTVSFFTIFVLVVCLSLTACFAEQPSPVASIPAATPAVIEKALPASVYTPPAGLSPQEVVKAYLEQTYLSYCSFVDIDLTAILDTRMPEIRSSIAWGKMLNQRRRLLQEHGLCYVNTEAYPYTVRFLNPSELKDDRLVFWDAQELTQEGEVLLHFVIEGEPGRVYPPQFAVNAQHTMRLYPGEDGEWNIVFHYFPGSIRKYGHNDNIPSYTDAEMLAMLRQEFAPATSTAVVPEDPSAIPYDSGAVVAYAYAYTESLNPAFYNVGDWMGNCANFTSQCISTGFGGRMTESWYAGEGGGSLAWENVRYFWDYATAEEDLSTQILDGILAAQPGDLLQTASLNTTEDDRFNHSLMVVDTDTLLLAQNSPGCFVYYSDLVNVSTRLLRPGHLVDIS